ncbi:MAG: hypothetical protein WAN28_03670, partial [Terracidiphilus sp.]
AIQTRPDQDSARPRTLAAIALLCVLLLAFLAMAQVMHAHQDVSDADHCPLCIVMHTAAPVAAATAVLTLIQVASATPVLEVRPVSRNWHAKLFTRPPPAF